MGKKTWKIQESRVTMETNVEEVLWEWLPDSRKQIQERCSLEGTEMLVLTRVKVGQILGLVVEEEQQEGTARDEPSSGQDFLLVPVSAAGAALMQMHLRVSGSSHVWFLEPTSTFSLELSPAGEEAKQMEAPCCVSCGVLKCLREHSAHWPVPMWIPLYLVSWHLISLRELRELSARANAPKCCLCVDVVMSKWKPSLCPQCFYPKS